MKDHPAAIGLIDRAGGYEVENVLVNAKDTPSVWVTLMIARPSYRP